MKVTSASTHPTNPNPSLHPVNDSSCETKWRVDHAISQTHKQQEQDILAGKKRWEYKTGLRLPPLALRRSLYCKESFNYALPAPWPCSSPDPLKLIPFPASLLFLVPLFIERAFAR